jgi:carbon storage regulator
MLVLTRRIGQQIVLPGRGVTIDVIDVERNQVRIGISATADVGVHRSEVGNRIHYQSRSQPGDNITPKNQAAELVAELSPPKTTKVLQPDLDQRLAEWIIRRTGSQINRLSVKTIGDGIVISGSASSYYARQLAQAAVKEILDTWSPHLLQSVEYEIDVVDGTSVTAPGRTGGSSAYIATD